ncbi:hypothetical protein [Myroides guanonis]|uniref:Lipoprotein n=1 Tax=Myroides guanonis TaxID=1150112 RepID=A0A1I3QS90_9FLAO|nr:hypothetical protein [Myroides guanonis]SFJ36948.1 hypothetical protein SAMN04487893_106111 [Myroides guanonis]
MMKKKALIVTLSFLSLGAIFFTSCEKESIQSELLDESKVGESIVRVQYNDTLIIRKGISGVLNGSGEFSFKLEMLGKDYMNILTLGFEEGTYPTNINVAKYFFSELGEDVFDSEGEKIGKTGEFGSSLDISRPQYSSGYIKINRVNKLARAVNGEFKIKIFPPLMNELNLRPFEVQGEFINLRYDRVEAQYFDATVDGKSFVSGSAFAQIEEENLVVNSSSSVSEESIKLKFNKDLEQGVYGSVSIEGTYVSPLGVVYNTSKELTKSSLHVRKNESNVISASFTLQLKNKQGGVIEVKGGDFRLPY